MTELNQKPFNQTIYFNNLIDLENKYSDIESTFENHDDWVNFINNRMQDFFTNLIRSVFDNINVTNNNNN